MNLRPHAARPRSLPIDLTAMVDVVFLLIIFFLTTTSLIEKTRVPLELARESGMNEPPTALPSLVVNVTAGGEYIVDGRLLSGTEVLEVVDRAVAAAEGDVSRVDLLIRADRASALIHVNELARGLAARGVRGWRLATQSTPGRRPGGNA